MLKWIKAKTDWQPTDYINVDDFNRIRNNILYLMQEHVPLFGDIQFTEPITGEETVGNWAYAEEWNNLEDRLEDFLTKTVYAIDGLVGKKKNYNIYSPYIDYEELNRIEKTCEIYQRTFLGRHNSREHLSYELGNYGGVKI